MIETAVSATQSAEAIDGLRNAILFGKMMGSIHPEVMQCIATAVGETMGAERCPVAEPPSLLSLLGQFRRKELRRSVALINFFSGKSGPAIEAEGLPQPKAVKHSERFVSRGGENVE